MQDLNWKNPEDYEFAEDLSPHELAWEFLRRNQHYIKKYQEVHSLRDLEIAETSDKNAADSGKKYIVGELVTPKPELLKHYAVPFLLDSMYDPNMQYKDGVKFKITIPFEVTKASDLHEFLDHTPFANYVDYLQSSNFSVEGHDAVVSGLLPKEYGLDKNYCAFVFDVSLGLDKQIKFLEKKITQLKKERNIKSRTLRTTDRTFKRHLRVLDALSEGASKEEIIDVLGFSESAYNTGGTSKKKQADPYIRDALKMSNSGYKNLVYQSE